MYVQDQHRPAGWCGAFDWTARVWYVMSQISAELQRARSEVDCIRSYSFAARPIESLILEWSSQSAASDRCACVYPLISTRQASVRASQLILFISLLRTAVFKSLDCFSFFFFFSSFFKYIAPLTWWPYQPSRISPVDSSGIPKWQNMLSWGNQLAMLCDSCELWTNIADTCAIDMLIRKCN